MWPDDELRELKERISQMADEELLRMVNTDAADYRAEALDFARSELGRRGIPATGSGRSFTAAAAAGPGASLCSCGREWRSGSLFADQEMTIVFSDTQEERFVKVLACGRCGQVKLMVDFETDVEEE